jgi:hypothetical protein
MKEKKKLVTKVESLARKVHSLQTKLATAKQTVAATPSTALAATAFAPALSPVHSHSPVASSSRLAHAVTRSTHDLLPTPVAPPAHIMPVPALPFGVSQSQVSPRSRLASGPSNATRGKTPEPRLPAVFRRAQTPEPPKTAPELLMHDRMPTTSMVGQKRAAPDDLDEHQPAQGFTSEGIPFEREHGDGDSTPRARKSLRSGFTPVRHTTTRPLTTIGFTSPVRESSEEPLIADVTNSPRGSAAQMHATSASDAMPGGKRGGAWVNRLKGGQRDGAGRSVSAMRSLFERGSS